MLYRFGEKTKTKKFLPKLAYNLVFHIKKCFSIIHDKKKTEVEAIYT